MLLSLQVFGCSYRQLLLRPEGQHPGKRSQTSWRHRVPLPGHETRKLAADDHGDHEGGISDGNSQSTKKSGSAAVKCDSGHPQTSSQEWDQDFLHGEISEPPPGAILLQKIKAVDNVSDRSPQQSDRPYRKGSPVAWALDPAPPSGSATISQSYIQQRTEDA